MASQAQSTDAIIKSKSAGANPGAATLEINVKLPDLSDTEKMSYIGKMTVLRKARREAGQKLRDMLIPMLNNLEGPGVDGWHLIGAKDLLDEIGALNEKIAEIN